MNQFLRSRSTRRQFLAGAGASLAAAGLARSGRAASAASANSAENLDAVEWPPDIGQTELQVYVPETGHTIRGTMLDYWRANGGAAVYGNPISEPFGSQDGYYSQAFERAIFQYRPEYRWTEEPIVRLMPIGQLALEAHGGNAAVAGRRDLGGGDRRHLVWRPQPADSRSARRATGDGGVYDETTGHTITGDFLSWYEAHEGEFYLGRPLSQTFDFRGQRAQYYEGGLLVRQANGRVRLASLGSEMARPLRIDTSPVKRNGLPRCSEELFATAPNPYPVGDPATPGRHWIEVSLDQQYLWARQGNTVVLESYVSTGLAPNTTDPGLFHVRLKYPSQTMSGFTNSSGEVTGFGTVAPDRNSSFYEVPDVPNVMYFSVEAAALHGCYWHNNFGYPMSHGCVNLPLDVAAWMYGWAPLGTMVWIH